MIILVASLVASAVLGSCLALVAYCCVHTRRKQIIENNNEKTFQSFNQSNSYIHYNSPRYSLRGGKKERKGSTASALTFSSNGSFRSLKVSKLREAAVDDLHDLHELDMNTPEDDAQYYLKMDEKVTESLQSNIQEISLGNMCNPNHSGNITDLADMTNATTRTLHGTTTSLCEQCLSPSDHVHPAPTNTEGTSTSLPATTVEVAKAALGMTNPATASDFPVVCDSCLSPSKLGNTAKSLNLPNLRLLDLDRGQKKVPNPNGIITNPRMKNPHLNTLRDTMFEFNAAALPNITERSSDAYDNSFDSLLSPSKTCDWLSSDPFGYSSGEESPDEENDRMIKIQPQIKVRSSRTQSEGTYFDRKNENYDKDRKMSYQEHRKDAQILEIELSLQPTYPTTVQEDLTALSTNNMFRVSSSKFPFGGDNCSIVPPPSPFRAIIDIDNGIVTKENKVLNHSKSCLMQETRRQDSKTSLLKESIMNTSRSRLMKDFGLGQNEPEVQNSPTSHLVWDSTFEAIKTLETSMKLLVTPYSNKVKSRKGNKDDQEDNVNLIKQATRDSASSIGTNDTPDRSCTSQTSNASLVWDNSCELLDSKTDIDVSVGDRTRDLGASDASSVDIDEIINRVAPNLSRCDVDISDLETLKPSTASRLCEFLDKNPPSKYDKIVSSPLLHQTVYVSVTNLDELNDDDGDDNDHLSNEGMKLRSSGQLESSPIYMSQDQHLTSKLPSPIQFPLPSASSSSDLLAIPETLSLSSSPISQLDDYLSTCSSLESYKTIINDDSSRYHDNSVIL